MKFTSLAIALAVVGTEAVKLQVDDPLQCCKEAAAHAANAVINSAVKACNKACKGLAQVETADEDAILAQASALW